MTTADSEAVEVEYRKVATIRATQWWKDGDHPAVIRKSAKSRYADEGIPWIETLEGGHVVTPGDWIATGIQGEHWPIKPDIFAITYEPVAAASPQLPAEPVQDRGLVEAHKKPVKWEFDPKDGYVFFRPEPLTRYVVAELQSSDDKYGHLIVDAVNEKLDRELGTASPELVQDQQLVEALTELEQAGTELLAATDAYNEKHGTFLCGGVLFRLARAVGDARLALSAAEPSGEEADDPRLKELVIDYLDKVDASNARETSNTLFDAMSCAQEDLRDYVAEDRAALAAIRSGVE